MDTKKTKTHRYAFLIGGIIVLLILYLQFGEQIRVYYITHSFLKSLVQRDFDHASNYIYYETEGTKKELKKQWVGKVSTLEQDGIAVVGYKSVDIHTNDGYAYTQATLILKENGLEKSERVIFKFSNAKGKLGINGVQQLESPAAESPWMDIFSYKD